MFKLNAKAIVPVVKTGAKVALPAAGGFLFSHMGAAVAAHLSPGVAGFIAKNPKYGSSIVRLAIGIPLGLLVAFFLAKKNMKTFFKLGALSVVGSLGSAAAVPATTTALASATESLKQMFKKGAGATPALPAPGAPDLKLLPSAPADKAAGMESYYDFQPRNRTAL